MDDIDIRDAFVSDIDSIIALYSSYSDKKLSMERLKKLFGEYPATVAVLNGDIIGFVYSGRFAPDVLELMNIFVGQSYRNKHLGGRLLAHFEEKAFNGYKGIILVNSALYHANEEKKSAKSFYLRNNYKLLMSTTDSFVFGKTK